MKIRIVSTFLLGNPDCQNAVWEGDVPSVDVFPSKEVDKINDALFRFFNRVDEQDAQRLEEVGYRFPSLSAGDVIVWLGESDTISRIFLVDSVGFKEIMPGIGLWPRRSQVKVENIAALEELDGNDDDYMDKEDQQ